MPGDICVLTKEKQLWNVLLWMDLLYLVDNIKYSWGEKFFFQTSAFVDRPKFNLPDVFF